MMPSSDDQHCTVTVTSTCPSVSTGGSSKYTVSNTSGVWVATSLSNAMLDLVAEQSSFMYDRLHRQMCSGVHCPWPLQPEGHWKRITSRLYGVRMPVFLTPAYHRPSLQTSRSSCLLSLASSRSASSIVKRVAPARSCMPYSSLGGTECDRYSSTLPFECASPANTFTATSKSSFVTLKVKNVQVSWSMILCSVALTSFITGTISAAQDSKPTPSGTAAKGFR
mmetsp:Transcript_33281/g.85053  ORF Transcript_33281/g.85053 Transcript_33281/m.85053 type:complete len:223 (-) Transcript_33281:921-1589(-)